MKLDKTFYPYMYEGGKLGVHPSRWLDKFSPASTKEEDKLILIPSEIRERNCRDFVYNGWRRLHGLPPRRCKFQLIQILSEDHAERRRFATDKDWWRNFKDCLFRVWVQPETFYDDSTKTHIQWYCLAPEDSEMVLRAEMDAKGFIQPPRDPIKERWLSCNPNIRYPLLVPVECCRHFRHETTAGSVPIGL